MFGEFELKIKFDEDGNAINEYKHLDEEVKNRLE